ncbi:MAG: toprim domain-containing protein [Brachymonas sp.]|nr:toprim domain-containing protein [Brachymonas sp.]
MENFPDASSEQTMYYRSQASAQLINSQEHGVHAELLLVEGESAARSAAQVRNAGVQAVLPLQGKPLNAWKATATKVQASPLYGQLAQALGLPGPTEPLAETALPQLQFGRLVLLFDPDADGIHIGALVLLYLQRWQPVLLQQQRVVMVRPPMGAMQTVDAETGEITHQNAYSPEHLRALQQAMAPENAPFTQTQVYRGLGSMPPDVLRKTCIDPDTRQAHAVTEQEMQQVVDIFGGSADKYPTTGG